MEDMNSNRRTELAGFLRARRARLSPRQAGLPEAGTPGRRRTPGLRRQEVAQLAGLSVDYYIRLEQARGPHPSRQVLAALARALMLTADERDYLFRMAGEAPPLAPRPGREITPGLRHLLDSMPCVPAYVVDAASNVLAWNQLATHFIGDLSGYEDRNMIRWTFLRAPQDVVLERRRLRPLHQVHGRRPARRLRPLPGRPRYRQPGHRDAGAVAAIR